jgi:hypothetical protein
VSNPRDKIDAWLDSEVEPLAPPPGTFERISKRARRRKANQVLLSAAAVVVVVAAAAVTPRVASALFQGSGRRAGHPIAAGPPHSPARPTPPPAHPKGGGKPSSRSATAVPTPGSPLSRTTSGIPLAASFRPTSITETGYGIGAVIGQAAAAGRCASVPGGCTSIAGTANDGHSWYGVSAPSAGAPQTAAGATQLRYLGLKYGWAYGPALYATTNGGASWTREPTGGLRVTDLETAGHRAFALFASCSGGDSSSGSGYAAGCTSFSLRTSVAGSTTWQPVAVPQADRTMSGSAGQPAAASLILASGTVAAPDTGTGYLLTPSGQLLSGTLAGGAWTVIGRIPASCQVGAAQPGGQPAGVQLASGAAAAAQLVLSCDGPASAGEQAKDIFTSSDGVSWQQDTAAPGAGTATSLAASSGDLIVLATTAGIDYSSDGGTSWQAATFSPAPGTQGPGAPAGGFSYVGMTTATQGVAVPVDPGLGEVFVTADGGRSWQARPITGG